MIFVFTHNPLFLLCYINVMDFNAKCWGKEVKFGWGEGGICEAGNSVTCSPSLTISYIAKRFSASNKSILSLKSKFVPSINACSCFCTNYDLNRTESGGRKAVEKGEI
jgi:hypothetical protein